MPAPRQTLARRLAGGLPSYRRGDGQAAILFLLPGFVPFLLFTVLATAGLSLSHWDLVAGPRWAGLDNYQTLFDDDVFR